MPKAVGSLAPFVGPSAPNAPPDGALWWDTDDTLVATLSGGSGTVFPTSPVAGQLFFRTDHAMQFYWDGTRWLSTQLIAIPLVNNEAFLPFTLTNGILRGSSAIAGALQGMVIAKLSLNLYVGTPHNASDYWDVYLQDAAGTNVYTAPTSWTTTAAPNVWGVSISSPGDVWGATSPAGSVGTHIRLLCVKSNNPGALYITAVVYARLIAT